MNASAGPPHHTENSGLSALARTRASASPDERRTYDVSMPVSSWKACVMATHQSSCGVQSTVRVSCAAVGARATKKRHVSVKTDITLLRCMFDSSYSAVFGTGQIYAGNVNYS